MNDFIDFEMKFKTAMKDQEEGNYLAAINVLQQLADENYPPAIGNLGCMYQLGLGVEQDGGKAVELLTKASDLGFGPAAHNLGTIYGAGISGIEPDAELSRYYRNKAIELGSNYIKP